MNRYLIILAALTLSACGTVPDPTVVIQGSCKVPEKLDYVAQPPAQAASVDTPLRQHLKDDAAERTAHGTIATDYNALVTHVKGCP
jgi:hypothetical protein